MSIAILSKLLCRISRKFHSFMQYPGYAYDKAGNITTDADESGSVRLITFNGDNFSLTIYHLSVQSNHVLIYFVHFACFAG